MTTTTVQDPLQGGFPVENPTTDLTSGLTPQTLSQSGAQTAWGFGPTPIVAQVSLNQTGFASQLLSMTDFGFTVPSNATIQAVAARFSAANSSGTVTDNQAAFCYQGSTLENVAGHAAPAWTTVNANLGVLTYMVSGSGLTPAIVNDPSFGFNLQLESTAGASRTFIESAQIFVSYTIPTVPYVLIDHYAIGRTQGTSFELPIGSQATLSEPWNILGYSLTLYPQLQSTPGDLVVNPAGLLGDVYGGLEIGQAIAPNVISTPGVALPKDMTMVSKIIDGSQDEVPWTAGQALGIDIQLPQPVYLPSNRQINLGLWMLPGIASCYSGGQFDFVIAQANYTVYYEIAS